MASLLRKLRPALSSVSDGNDDHDFEYSIAMVYNGPALSYSIPEVAPIKIDQIPVASIPPFPAHQISVPVIQPIVKANHTQNHESNAKPKQGRDSFHCSNSNSPPFKSNCHSRPVEFSNRMGNSGSLVNVSQRLPASVGSFGVRGSGEDRGFQSEKNATNSDIIESDSSSRSVFYEISTCRQDDCKNDTPRHVKRPSTVTFRDLESNDMVVNKKIDDSSQAGSAHGRPKNERTGKKGTCRRCHKGNRFTEKEVCIVCSAKYCRNCVLRAMGSMPEGRKCVTCIGKPIDENKRRILGKCSRMLKHLLYDELGVKQIMHAEMFCKGNQIPAELILVNGEPLDQEELMLLLSSPNPPKRLKPGVYWYDKASGFWGKEGQRPCQIISPHLDVGGRLQKNASNGNTNVSINGREITKAELRMLKVVGVPCEGSPDFWVNADGSYQEVGQKNIKGCIWDKTGTKLVCAMLSLPFPSVTPHGEGERASGVGQDYLEKKILHKFLLVGSNKSGTSTIFKQAKLQYEVPFSENERQNIKLVILSNLYTYLGILLMGRENFAEEESLLENKKKGRLVDDSTSSDNTGKTIKTTVYSIGPRLKAFSDRLVKYMVSGNLEAIFLATTREYEPLVEELWRDAAIQATYNRRNELEMLPRNASYFLDRAVEISKIDYEPSDMDIMYAEGITLSNSLASMEFSFSKLDHEAFLDPEFQHEPSLRYQLIRVHQSSLGENCKWLGMFEDIDVVLFCVALTDYDEYTVDRNGVSTNKMLAAKRLFEKMITHPTSNDKQFLLVLTKFDLFEEKIELVPLTRCEWFCDFNPVISHSHTRGSTSNQSSNTPLAQRAFQYIAVKFKRLFHSLTSRKLFVSLVTGLEPYTIDEALRYAREIMVCERWDSYFVNEKSEITTTSLEIEEDSFF